MCFIYTDDKTQCSITNLRATNSADRSGLTPYLSL